MKWLFTRQSFKSQIGYLHGSNSELNQLYSFPCAFHTKFSSEWPSSSEKIRFEFLYVHDFGPMSSNDLDLQYSHTFMKSISCLYLSTFRSQGSIVSEKSTVFTFSYRKA